MKAINQKKYSKLHCEKDENINGILIYGERRAPALGEKKTDLICFYQMKRGFEAYYHLKSVLTKHQIDIIRGWIAEFNPKYEVQI